MNASLKCLLPPVSWHLLHYQCFYLARKSCYFHLLSIIIIYLLLLMVMLLKLLQTNISTIFFKIYPLVDPFAANKIIHTSWYFYIIILAFAPACACSSSAWWNIIFKDLHDSSINVKIKCIKSTETETMQCFLTCFWVAEKEYSNIFFNSNCYIMDFEQCINFQSTFTFLFTADHSLVVGEWVSIRACWTFLLI